MRKTLTLNQDELPTDVPAPPDEFTGKREYTIGEAEIAREMAAHERALLGVVVEVLPEETRRAWARIQRPPAPQVRVLKTASEGGGEEGQS